MTTTKTTLTDLGTATAEEYVPAMQVLNTEIARLGGLVKRHNTSLQNWVFVRTCLIFSHDPDLQMMGQVNDGLEETQQFSMKKSNTDLYRRFKKFGPVSDCIVPGNPEQTQEKLLAAEFDTFGKMRTALTNAKPITIAAKLAADDAIAVLDNHGVFDGHDADQRTKAIFRITRIIDTEYCKHADQSSQTEAAIMQQTAREADGKSIETASRNRKAERAANSQAAA